MILEPSGLRLFGRRRSAVLMVVLAAGLFALVGRSAEPSSLAGSESRTGEWFVTEYKKALPILDQAYGRLVVEFEETSLRNDQPDEVLKGMYGRDGERQFSQAIVTESQKGAGRHWAAVFTPEAAFNVSAKHREDDYVLAEWVGRPSKEQLSVSMYLQHFPCGWEMLANVPSMIDDPSVTLSDVRMDINDPRQPVTVKFLKRFESGIVREGRWRFLSAKGWIMESSAVDFNDPQQGTNYAIGLEYKFDDSNPPKLLEVNKYTIDHLSGKTISSARLTVSSFEFSSPDPVVFTLAHYGIKKGSNVFFTPALVILLLSLVILIFFAVWRRWVSG